MPLISTLAAVSARAFGFLSGFGQYFVGRYIASGLTEVRSSIDASENYLFGGTIASEIALVKIDKNTKAIAWQKTSTMGEFVFAINADSSDNVYFVASGASNEPTSIKLNSSGVVQWQKSLTGGQLGTGGYASTSGDTYTLSGSPYPVIAKYNSSGALQWQKRLQSGSQNALCYHAYDDASDNLYVAGYTNTGGGALSGFIAKYNSSGSLQWQKAIPYASSHYVSALAVDSAGNIYAGLTSNGLIKFDSSGAILWQKTMDAAISGFATDVDNNLYAIAGGIIYKFTSAGSPVIKITVSPDGTSGNFVTSPANYLFIARQAGYVNKLPLDGSSQGTYSVPGVGSTVYSSDTFTVSTASYSTTNTTFTDDVATLTDTTPSYTFSNLSNTLSLTSF